MKDEEARIYPEIFQELLQRREEVAELMKRLDFLKRENEVLQKLLGKHEIRRWYQGAILREKDKTDPDGFAKEAIEEIVHYLGAEEILADISLFCKMRLEEKKKQQSR